MMMRNTLKKLIPVILVILLSLSLVDCSCSEPAKESESATESGIATTAEPAAESTAESKEEPKADITGQYEITGMITDGKETTAEDLALMKSKGLNCTITLKADGTGVLDLFGEEKALTWDDSTISTAEKQYLYTCEGDQLTVTDKDSSLTFTRTELP